MDSHDPFDRPAGAARPGYGHVKAEEFELLQDVIRLLPSGITVQDEGGDLLLVNDAASDQLGMSEGGDAAPGLVERRAVARQVIQNGQPVVAEEVIASASGMRFLLTSHRPINFADRTLLLSSSADITEQKLLEDQLFRSAYFDELTQLPTRGAIEHRVASLLRGTGLEQRFALAFFDIDGFKQINDYYGHAAGDMLLVEVARRLSRELRDSDMLSRISGDEFLLLLNPVQGIDEIAEFIQSVLDRLTAPFFIDGSELFASSSIGVSIYPDHGQSFDVLRHNADIAMYRAKKHGKGRAAFFDAAMEHEAAERTRVEQSLRLAILEKRFCCAFQPKVDIRTQEVQGIEALVRLRDDEGVIKAPGSFINLASELGLIDELTHLVLAEIVRSIDSINETFGPGAKISINVAAKQAGNTEFMQSFARALEDTGYATRFMIEVTEDAFVAKAQFQNDILPLFRKIGVGISIDDFGTGYSSLSALADITADELKIDRSFITDIHKRPRSQGILRAIESLSEALGMTVIAEGVETFEELAYLQAATRIRYAQGYYFSRPIFLEELKPAAAVGRRSALDSRPVQQNRQAYSRAQRRG